MGDEALLAAVLQHRPETARVRVFGGYHPCPIARGVRYSLEPPLDRQTGRYAFWHGAGYWLRHGYRLFGELGKRKIAIVAGGGMLNDHVGGRCCVRRKRILAMKSLNCRVGFLGIGVDRITLPPDRDAVRDLLFHQVDYCSVRDAASAQALAAIGIPGEKFLVASDLAFALQFPTHAPQRERARELRSAVLGINLRPLFHLTRERGGEKRERRTRYAEACRHLVDKLGQLVREVRAVPFNPEDAAFLGSLSPKGRLQILAPPSDPMSALGAVMDCDLFVGMRYHAIVFSVLAGVPVVPIVYAPKSRALADELGFSPAALAVGDGIEVEDQSLNVDEILGQVNAVWNSREAMRQQLSQLAVEKRRVAIADMSRCWNVLAEAVARD
jgi:N-acetylglucosaminyldiphosphoundecaprenol N-acetyl-beta-D-mannosaminyltransferase